MDKVGDGLSCRDSEFGNCGTRVSCVGMVMSQYVQHMSGEGKKWPCVTTADHFSSWCVHDDAGNQFRLPKVEYLICAPPEKWIDVTTEIEFDDTGRLWHKGKHINPFGQFPDDYRLCKVQLFEPGNAALWQKDMNSDEWRTLKPTPIWAFVVEKKVSE